jgi:hypothetical protein
LSSVLLISYCDKVTGPEPPVPGNGVTVLVPNGNTSYYIGDTMKISWELSDTLSGLEIDFSPTGGHDYFLIAQYLPASMEFQNRQCTWIIPDTVVFGNISKSTQSDSCRIFIHEYLNYAIGDISDNLFSIRKR